MEKVYLYDKDELYVVKFAEYVRRCGICPFEVIGVTDIETLIEKKDEENKNLLIVTERMVDKLNDMDVDGGNIIILTEQKGIKSMNKHPCIFRYQRADQIIRKLINIYADYMDVNCNYEYEGGNSFIVYICSPVGRCGKTKFSYELAHELGANNKVLHLNFEEYSSFIEEGSYDISDLLYFSMQKEETFLLRLESVVRNNDTFDYVSPARIAHGYQDVELEDYKKLLDNLKNSGRYAVIVVDLPVTIRMGLKLIDKNDWLIIPTLSEERETRKQSNYLMNHRSCLDNIRYELIHMDNEQEVSSYIRKVADLCSIRINEGRNEFGEREGR